MKIRVEIEGDPDKLDLLFRDVDVPKHKEGSGKWVFLPELPGDVGEVMSAVIAGLLPPVGA